MLPKEFYHYKRDDTSIWGTNPDEVKFLAQPSHRWAARASCGLQSPVGRKVEGGKTIGVTSKNQGCLDVVERRLKETGFNRDKV